jgi:hypothetical protein
MSPLVGMSLVDLAARPVVRTRLPGGFSGQSAAGALVLATGYLIANLQPAVPP